MLVHEPSSEGTPPIFPNEQVFSAIHGIPKNDFSSDDVGEDVAKALDDIVDHFI